jgi:hypothetical protein
VDVDAERVLDAAPVRVDVTELLLEIRELVEGLVVAEEERLFDVVPVELLMLLVVGNDVILLLGLRL